MNEIKGKAVVVTGGGSGIGRGLALECARLGAKVVVGDILKAPAEKVAAEIKAAGGTAIAVQCDVCERSEVKRMKDEANKAFGRVSYVFANAGATNFERLTDMKDSEVDWIITVNLMGVMHCMQTFLPDMIAAREGNICATASIAGLFPNYIPVHSTYGAAKLGIVGLMMNMRLELEEFNVGSSVYCPGGVATNMKAGNESYRPARFGGPGKGDVFIPAASAVATQPKVLAAELVAKHVVQMTRENKPVILDHSNQRSIFTDTYVKHVMAAFDDAAVFEKAEGIQI